MCQGFHHGGTLVKSKIQWWSNIHEDYKVRLKKINRKIHYCQANSIRDALIEERNKIRKGYENLIKDSKKNAWREFISQNQPWCKPYKVITKVTESVLRNSEN